MELGKIHYFENIENHSHREFIQAHNHCILCRSVLELRHIRVVETSEIKEEAYCGQCDVRARARIHSVQ